MSGVVKALCVIWNKSYQGCSKKMNDKNEQLVRIIGDDGELLEDYQSVENKPKRGVSENRYSTIFRRVLLALVVGFSGCGIATSIIVVPRLVIHTPETRQPVYSSCNAHIYETGQQYIDEKLTLKHIIISGWNDKKSSNAFYLMDYSLKGYLPAPLGLYTNSPEDLDLSSDEYYVVKHNRARSNGKDIISISKFKTGNYDYLTTGINPSFSPDNKHVAFMDYRDDKWGVYIIHINGTDEHRIADAEDIRSNLKWSPDGKKFLFLGIVPGSNKNDNRTRIAVMNVDGTERKFISDYYRGDRPVWDADSSRILVTHNGYLSFLYLDGKQIDTTLKGHDFVSVPDGHIVYVDYQEQDGVIEEGIFIADNSGANPRFALSCERIRKFL
jgi:hypothetical protein